MAAMVKRRDVLRAAATGLALPATGGCSYDATAYEEAADAVRRPLPPDPGADDLIRYATLAANGHNTQPWLFRSQARAVEILPDLSRRTPAADPDDHHLHASLGCAAENLSLAAMARGKSGEIVFDGAGEGRATVDLSAGPREETELFAAIPHRQCVRASYNTRPVTAEIVRRLERAATGQGMEAVFATDTRRVEEILELVIAGNSAQINDPAFVAELRDWIRFNPDAALAARDGLYSATSGNPSMPGWLGRMAFRLFLDEQSENDKYAEQIRSSAGIVIFAAATDDPEGWFSAGRAYQRFALQATVDGLKTAFVNQPVEVATVRRQLRDLLGFGDRRPDLVVRFGYGPAMPRSLRRPVDAVRA